MTNDDFERRLREGLHREADRITPHDRRTEILAMTHHETQTAQPARRWLIPVATAASVALISAVVWGASNSGDSQQATPAAPSPTTAPSAAQSSAPISNGTAAGSTINVTLPAYFVGQTSAAGDRFGLYREFVSTSTPAGATPGQKARAAVAVAMKAQPLPGSDPYLRPWSATTVSNVTATPSQITITLSGPGASGFTPAQTKLAVQELVWTAQAAIGQGTPPVKFVIATGASKLFGTYPTSAAYNRPAAGVQYEVLAPIWVISPTPGKVIQAGAAVVASGQSCAFEGTTQWQLNRGGTLVKSGTATATSGCPTRGTWQVKLGALSAGSYTFRMYEVSMENGKAIAETSRLFTVQ